MYVVLARSLGWTKSQVDAEDADYIEELVTALAADADIDAEERKKSEKPGKG